MRREAGPGTGTVSLIRASIRAAHNGNSNRAERVLHPRRSGRSVEPVSSEPRIELKVGVRLFRTREHRLVGAFDALVYRPGTQGVYTTELISGGAKYQGDSCPMLCVSVSRK
jgi:hypothetical protein